MWHKRVRVVILANSAWIEVMMNRRLSRNSKVWLEFVVSTSSSNHPNKATSKMSSQLSMSFGDEGQNRIGIETFESLPEISQLSVHEEELGWKKEIGLKDSQADLQVLECRKEPSEALHTTGSAPLIALNHIYDLIDTGNQLELQNEVFYFFWQPHWVLSEIPKPEETDRKRHAGLAVLLHYLVVSTNQAIERGCLRNFPETKKEREELTMLEEEPRWVGKAPKLDKPLVIRGESGEVVSGDDISALFLSMIL